ncbi:chemotaxis protein CheZ [Rhodothalassium salexigens DSM 2132]|uniref:Chemotaxis protein CheZ n=1 Tax=Rhodothalassium salexigens DSM 2132 TaxID=1188247 RepID=A0A4R2PRU9_RHOSA|nr:protein phosphatase CheZ [Rhodothalassium salexigens]MBB4210405.1 chemotaxis protein CheZ [Rhodothalassium salexigens DSM 2132]MBK1638606.1 hypothetical protein [Rhodothalassium salexigens DSM 2132]TCP38569.1 chemotaxis protein CheZ [Rhodothalassium salexigens DSM 2132]
MASDIAATLEQHVQSIKERQGDQVAVDDVAEVVGSLISSAEGELTLDRVRISRELRALLDEIGATKSEIASIRPKSVSERDLPEAQDELDSVIKSTESSAEKIMDAADQISEMSGDIGGEQGEKLMALASQIFEASSFQDLTGQRVTKVIGVMRTLEERLRALAATIGDDYVEDRDDQVFDEQTGEVINPDLLTHGPQLEGQGNSQDDIDALLASFD